MELEKILKGINVVSLAGKDRIGIDNITFDSRSVTEGSLFVAVRGSKNDGHGFIDGAVKSGASAIICETFPAAPDKKVTWVKTTDSDRLLQISSATLRPHLSLLASPVQTERRPSPHCSIKCLPAWVISVAFFRLFVIMW